MKIEGKIWQEGALWIVEMPALDLMTQGETRKEAFEMAADLVESVVDERGFKAFAEPIGEDRFFLGANKERALIALALRRARERGGFTVRQAAEKLGSKSPNAFGAYEQGKVTPKIDTFSDMIAELDSEVELVLVRKKASA